MAQAAPPTPGDHLSRFTPGLDIQGIIDGSFRSWHVGSTTAISMSTTACNPGSVIGRWFAAPNNDHPFISQMYCRLHDGRFEQISEWSYVKHSFASTNSPGCVGLGSCVDPNNFQLLGLNCSDTYGASLNGDRDDLGPPGEINGWTGDWDFFGSHLDVGYPPTTPDGRTTTVSPVDSLQFRVHIDDTKLTDPGARFFAMCHYLHKYEPEDVRENNMSSREIRISAPPASNTSSISPIQFGTVLQRYDGARLESAANEVGGVAHDGRFYVASSVTQNPNGTFHYEFAIDNHGGNAELRIPLCSTATLANAGFKDIDSNGSNDWAISRQGNELIFAAPIDNAQRWNTIYNFWFDSDAAPGDGAVTIYQGNINPGANGTVTVAADVPGVVREFDRGGRCGGSSELSANGPAVIPNPQFVLQASNVPQGAFATLHVNFSGASTAAPPPLGLAGCELLTPQIALPTVGVLGLAFWRFEIPNDPYAEGVSVFTQAAIRDANGAVLGLVNLSNQFEFLVGNNLFTRCP